MYVEDHAIALHQVLENGVINETYNIGGINEIKNIVVAKKVCSILDEIHPIDSNKYNSYEELIKYVEDRPGHDKRYAINCTKIKDDLDWLPLEDFDSGMLKTVKWYLNKFNQ